MFDETAVFALLKQELEQAELVLTTMPHYPELKRAVWQNDALAVCEAAAEMYVNGLARVPSDKTVAFRALATALFIIHIDQWSKSASVREVGVSRFYGDICAADVWQKNWAGSSRFGNSNAEA